MPAARVENSAATVALGEITPLPLDLRDGDLLLLLAAEIGFEPRRLPVVTLEEAARETVPEVALRLAHRGGAREATLADFQMFDTLDPSIATPTTAMLLAVERAWNLHDVAVRELDPQELQELGTLLHAGDVDSARSKELQAQVDLVLLIEAAILLLDTADSVLLPAIEALGENAPWPAEALADPVGVLRIGGTGDDYENVDRILLLEPSGNDTYENNAGGTSVLDDVSLATLEIPVSIAIDWNGRDEYRLPRSGSEAQGGASLGTGLLLELEGDDHYVCRFICHGTGAPGVGYLRDTRGDDNISSGEMTAGVGSRGIGVKRDDSGDDRYVLYYTSGGYSSSEGSIGLLWDRDGRDDYGISTPLNFESYGVAEEGGRGWLVDEGLEEDNYATASTMLLPHGCNNCVWTVPYGADAQGKYHGHGNDNHGGLAYLLAVQEG